MLASSVHGNVDTCLQVMQHRIDLGDVHAPAAAVEYARRLAQRGVPLASLLRAYRVGHAGFFDWLLNELAEQTNDAEMVSTTALSMSRVVAEYIDQISEGLLSGKRIDVSAAEATLGCRLRQYHVGLVCWVGGRGQPRRSATGRRRPTG